MTTILVSPRTFYAIPGTAAIVNPRKGRLPDTVEIRVNDIALTEAPAGGAVIVAPLPARGGFRRALGACARHEGVDDRYTLTVAVNADDYCAAYGPSDEFGGNHEDLVLETAFGVDADAAPYFCDADTEIVGVFCASVLGREPATMLAVTITATFDELDELDEELA